MFCWGALPPCSPQDKKGIKLSCLPERKGEKDESLLKVLF